jgi:cytochrome P450
VSEGALFDFFNTTMLLGNGPEHRKRRAPMSRAFAFKLMTELRPRIRTIADAVHRRDVECAADLKKANPFPRPR